MSGLKSGLCFVALVVASGPGRAARRGEIIRGIYARVGAALDNRVWQPYGKAHDLDTQGAHGGRVCIRCANTDSVEAHGACQSVEFDQKQPRPLVVAGWAKLEGVSGKPSYRCSIYLDLRLQNGRNWPMKIAAFDPSKKGWQYAEEVYEPPAPIASARVYAFLRQQEGVAWFDDIYVGEIVDANGTRSPNLLQEPGFEREGKSENKHRQEFFSQLDSLGCNAFHFYKGVGWDTAMGAGELPRIDPTDPMLDFVKASQHRGLKVWLTVG